MSAKGRLALLLEWCFVLGMTTGGFVPMSECKLGRVTYYSPYDTGACGFGKLTGTTGPGYLFGAAPNEHFYANATHCGECYELVGPDGALRVMVTDLCPVKGNPVCDGSMTHFDLTEPSFPHLFADKKLGGGNVTWRLVECDVDGPVKMRLSEDSSIWWMALLVWNHRIGLRGVEYSEDGGSTWMAIERKSWNYWVWKPASGKSTFAFPMSLRIRGVTGEFVYATINEISDDTILAQSQFATAGGNWKASEDSNSMEEECCSPPDGFTTVYNDGRLLGVWSDWSYRCTLTLDSTAVPPHSGQSCIRADMQGWGGMQIGSNLAAPRSQYQAVEFWMRTDTVCNNCFLLSVGSDHVDVAIGTTTAGTWEHVNVSLIDLGVLELDEDGITSVVVKNNRASAITVYFDDIRFVKKASPPSNAMCAPATRATTFIATLCFALLLHAFFFL